MRSHLKCTADVAAKPDRRVFHSQCALRRSALATRGVFHAAQHLVEFGAVKVRPFTMTPANLLRVSNVFERIGGKQDEIRELSFFHVPSWFSISKKACGIDRGGLQRFEGSESRGHETLQFLVKAVAGKI